MRSQNPIVDITEQAYGSLSGLYIVEEPTGRYYKEGRLTAGLDRLILEDLCGFGEGRISHYDYYDVTGVQIEDNSIHFRSGENLRLIWLRKGECRYLMHTIRLKAREAQMGFRSSLM